MDDLILKLKYFGGNEQIEDLKKAVQKKDEITPFLLKELDRLFEEEIDEEFFDEDYMLHIYSLYLLAEFKEKQLIERIIKLFKLDYDIFEMVFPEYIIEDFHLIIFNIFIDEIDTLKMIIEDKSIHEYNREIALNVLMNVYLKEENDREEAIKYIRSLIYNVKSKKEKEWTQHIMNNVIDHHLLELKEDIFYLYKKEYVNNDMNGDYDEFIDWLYYYEDNDENYYIDNVIDYFKKDIFLEDEEEMYNMKDSMDKNNENIRLMIEEEKKIIEKGIRGYNGIGRNDICPCGSGKKYKKCCLNDEDAIELKDYQELNLEFYPKNIIIEGTDEKDLTYKYDEEAVEIDKLLYLALRQRNTPYGIDFDEKEFQNIQMLYLLKAYDKFKDKMEKEEIDSLEEYDKKHMIHYTSGVWLSVLLALILDSNKELQYQDLIYEVDSLLFD